MTKTAGPTTGRRSQSACSTRRRRSAAAPTGIVVFPRVFVQIKRAELRKQCEGSDGKQRCAEWTGVAYDTPRGTFSPGVKTSFLTAHAHPGNFYPCWVSPDKEIILLTREWNSTFLMVPIIAMVLALFTLYLAISRYYRPAWVSQLWYRKLPAE